MDADFIRAQFDSAMRMVKYAVSQCAKIEDPVLSNFMRRELTEQQRFLERRFAEKKMIESQAGKAA